MFFVLFIGNTEISNIGDYLSNRMDMLSHCVLNLECKTVVCCVLIRFMLIFREHSLIDIDDAATNHAVSKISKGSSREVTSYIRDFY